MQEYIKFHSHSIDKSLHDFICKELKSEKLKIDKIFWKKLSNIISELENRRITLINKRVFLQKKITNVLNGLKISPKIKLTVDVDPINFA